MVRGCQRRVIMLRGEKESIFESALFVLKQDADLGGSESDMLKEATRIIQKSVSVPSRKSRKAQFFRAGGLFLCGFIIGIAVAVFSFLIFI